MMLSFVIFITIIVIVVTTGGLYLLNYFKRRRHSYMNMEQFGELLDRLEQNHVNDDNDNDSNAIEKDMFTKCPFYKANHEKSDVDYPNLFKYIRQFCCEKSLHTNRPGPVCPFLPRAFKEQYIYFFDDTSSTTQQELIQTVRKCRDDFLSILKPTESENKSSVVYKCLIILVRSGSISHRLVDQVQHELKPEFVIKYGLMLGEFHSSSNSSAMKNEDFYPLRTKVPLLVIRYLVANDILFLNQQDRYSKDLLLKLVEAYFDLHKKGSLHSVKDYHLRIAYEMFNELKANDGFDNCKRP